MRRAALLPALLLAACNSQPSQSESAEDYAARVGASGSAAEGAAPPSAANAAQPVAPPPGSDVRKLERLGDIGGVDLGRAAGSCTFSADGVPLLVGAAPADRSLPGRATVRIGGRLILLDGDPGGYGALASGNTYRGEGFTVELDTVGGENANLTITDDEGAMRNFSGKWACT